MSVPTLALDKSFFSIYHEVMRRIFLLLFTLSCSNIYHPKSYVISHSPTEEISDSWEEIVDSLEEEFSGE